MRKIDDIYTKMYTYNTYIDIKIRLLAAAPGGDVLLSLSWWGFVREPVGIATTNQPQFSFCLMLIECG